MRQSGRSRRAQLVDQRQTGYLLCFGDGFERRHARSEPFVSHHFRNAAGREILLVFEIGVRGDQDFEGLAFRGVEKLAVLEGGPNKLVRGFNRVTRQQVSQWRGSALIEQDAHLRDDKGTACRMLQHGARLLEGNAREELSELPDRHPVFEVLEESCHRHSRAAEHPGATDPLGVAIHHCAT